MIKYLIRILLPTVCFSLVACVGSSSNDDYGQTVSLNEDKSIYQSIGTKNGGKVHNFHVKVLDPIHSQGKCEALEPKIASGEARRSEVETFAYTNARHQPDYSGCTLYKIMNPYIGDISKRDVFKPEVRVLFSAEDYKPDPSLEWNATMRVRDAGEADHNRQTGWRITLRDDVPSWRGQRKIQLDTGENDGTRIVQKLAYDLLAPIDNLTSLRTHIVTLDIEVEPPTQAQIDENNLADFGGAEHWLRGCTNDKENNIYSCGLYVQLERVDKDSWANDRKLQREGNLFKATDFEFLPYSHYHSKLSVADPRRSLIFEKIIKSRGTSHDIKNLKEMLDALNANEQFIAVDYNNDFNSVFTTYFDPINFRRWLAVNILLGNRDTSSQNFFIYRPKRTKQFFFLPWDYDGVLTLEDSIKPRWREGISNWWGMVLGRRFMQDAQQVALLEEEIDQLYQTDLSPNALRKLLNSYDLSAVYKEIGKMSQRGGENSVLRVLSGSRDAAEVQKLWLKKISVISGQQCTVDSAAQVSCVSDQNVEDGITKNYKMFKKTLDRPMPFFLHSEKDAGQVKLSWNKSYDIKGRNIEYEWAISTSKNTVSSNSTEATWANECTDQDSPVDVLETPIKEGTASASDTYIHWTPSQQGTYYFQLVTKVLRDDGAYDCQVSFDNGYLKFKWQ